MLDYETKQSYTITVSVTDGEDDAGNPESPGAETIDDTIEVTVELEDVDPPGVPRVVPHRREGGTFIEVGEPLDKAIRLVWDPPQSGSPATHYRVYWWQTGNYSGTVTQVDVAALTAGRAMSLPG